MWLRRRKSYRLWTHVSLFVQKPFQDPSSIFRIQVNTHRDRFLRYQTVVKKKKKKKHQMGNLWKLFHLRRKNKIWGTLLQRDRGPKDTITPILSIQIYSSINEDTGFPGCARGKRTRLPMQDTKETRVWSLGWEDSLEEGMAIHSRILTWRFPWTEEPGGLQSTGLPRVRHD